jgi:hypothetical protein
MYTLLRYWRLREGLSAETPAFIVSLVIAELFFKFHSFTLECIGFLLLWTALGALFSFATRRWTATDLEKQA